MIGRGEDSVGLLQHSISAVALVAASLAPGAAISSSGLGGGVAVFLASEDARYLTGNTLFVDGGGHINGVPWVPELGD